jgi:hypothetical protein
MAAFTALSHLHTVDSSSFIKFSTPRVLETQNSICSTRNRKSERSSNCFRKYSVGFAYNRCFGRAVLLASWNHPTQGTMSRSVAKLLLLAGLAAVVPLLAIDGRKEFESITLVEKRSENARNSRNTLMDDHNTNSTVFLDRLHRRLQFDGMFENMLAKGTKR